MDESDKVLNLECGHVGSRACTLWNISKNVSKISRFGVKEECGR